MKFDHAAAVTMYQDGATLREVGEHYGASHEAIRLALIQCDVPIRSRGSGRPRQGVPLDAAQIAAEYASGTALVALAAEYHADYQRVRDAITGQGVPLRTRSEAQGFVTSNRADLPEQDLARRYEAGEYATALAAEFGVTTPTVVKRLRKAGVTIRPRGGFHGWLYA